MNTEWHEKNPMPQKAPLDVRVSWHREHAKVCGCRPIPASLVHLVNAAGTRSATRRVRKIKSDEP